jgi:hypothetical protein
MEEKRKGNKYFFNNKGYLGIRLDLANPFSALWVLEEVRDIIKTDIYRAKQYAQEQQKKIKLEVAKLDSNKFINEKMK